MDEFQAVLAAVTNGLHEPIRNPRAWISKLVKAALVGEFVPDWSARSQDLTEIREASDRKFAAAEARAAADRAAAGLPARLSKEQAIIAMKSAIKKAR